MEGEPACCKCRRVLYIILVCYVSVPISVSGKNSKNNKSKIESRKLPSRYVRRYGTITERTEEELNCAKTGNYNLVYNLSYY